MDSGDAFPYFPQAYARPMLEEWGLDREKGFFGEFFPLAMARQSMKQFAAKVDHSSATLQIPLISHSMDFFDRIRRRVRS